MVSFNELMYETKRLRLDAKNKTSLPSESKSKDIHVSEPYTEFKKNITLL